MKYIEEKDSVWHDPKVECPRGTTDVDFLFKDGRILKGEIVAEPCGFFAYIRDESLEGWWNLEALKWRFRSVF